MGLLSHIASLSIRALGSGSSGNCFLVEAAGEALLIDCGLPVKPLLQHLQQRGIDPRRLSAILLTHEHADHVRALNFVSTRFDVPVVSNRATLAAATEAVGTLRERPVATGSLVTAGPFEIGTFAVAHDATETIGFLIHYRDRRICYLTDTGHVPKTAVEPLRLADLLIIEANHDEDRVKRSRYPERLKARILAPTGHLSNRAAAEALAGVLDPARQTVWLAHLSAVTNSPRLARTSILSYLGAAGIRQAKVGVAERDRPSLAWHSAQAGYQTRFDF
jgi:phosphoribosyl 1,2-cyclic phosphodiesterase